MAREKIFSYNKNVMFPKFVHLHTHSHYSLLDGLAKIDELVHRAAELKMPALALTDHGNLYGAIEFYKKARAAGVKPILGVEAYVAPRGHQDRQSGTDDKLYHLTLLCENETGWQNLIQLITKANLYGFYYKPRVDKNWLREHASGLIALSGCYSGELIKTLLDKGPAAAEKTAREYQEIFGPDNFFIELGHHPGIDQKNHERIWRGLPELSRKTGIPLVATQDIHYLKKEDADYHDILLAVQTGSKLADGKRLTLKNDDFSMRGAAEMAELFKDFPEAIENTVKIADRSNLQLTLGKILLPGFPLPENETANSHLEKLIREKIGRRYQDITPEVAQRLNYELSVIEKTGFADYFLIVQDFINWAKERSIVVGPGRGSAAGSIISYILGITDVDPLKYGLLFERFLNTDRIQMPDIDIDFADLRRDEVIGYLREKYGENHVAHIITFGTMAARAAVRDVGRALGLPYAFCDRLAKMIPFGQNLGQALSAIKELDDLYKTNPDAQSVIDAAKRLEGVARHVSVHACGTVITKAPLTDYLPLQYAPQNQNIIVTQFEMHSVEELGLLKIDLLGLKNLTIIEETLRLVSQNMPAEEKIEISRIPLNDPAVFAMLQEGETTGVFQFESSGMRRYMKELKPTELEDLIALVSLYRPGPMELIPSYIKRKHGREKITYLHPKLEPILQKTYGIGIYQEQMMQIARDLAGYTLSEADTLRKAIGKKIKVLLDQQGQKLIDGMLKNGIDLQFAKQIWELFPPFARYGFNRSHGACYALIGYQTAYLKAHFPVEFMTGLLNADSKDIDRLSYLAAEAKKTGIEILPPDVNRSWFNFTPEGKHIRFGLAAIKNVGENIVRAIIENRGQKGPFAKFLELLYRIDHKDLNKKSLESLIKCGALDSLGLERQRALINLEEIVRFNSALKRHQRQNQVELFESAPLTERVSIKLKPAAPAAGGQKLAWEKELLGLYVSDHPLNRFRRQIAASRAQSIADLLKSDGAPRHQIAGLISKIHKIVTKRGQPMLFAKMEDFGDTIEVIVFSDVLEKTAAAWKEDNALLVSGRLSLRDGEPKLICESVSQL